MAKSIPSQYSAEISAVLIVGEHKLPMTRVGGGRLGVRKMVPIPALTPAIVEVTIDGEMKAMSILLTDGIQPDVNDDEIAYTIVKQAE